MIHLGNYEEYFILYMDNELTEEQVKMVDEFLMLHPDLQGELELLMSTRLPAENLIISKNELLASRMRFNIVDEELLLYIDNELPNAQKKIVELELQKNTDYRIQRDLLLAVKLDADEKVVHPYKNELYRNKEVKTIYLKPWMRIAAAVLFIAAAGILYWNNQPGPAKEVNMAVETLSGQPKTVANVDSKEQQRSTLKGNDTVYTVDQGQKIDILKPIQKDMNKLASNMPYNNAATNNSTVQQGADNIEMPLDGANRTASISKTNYNYTAVTRPAIKTPLEIVNNHPVTSVLADRTTNEDNATAEENNDVASSKGSVKGFLRKTTRLIEKRTGIDPTNDGELLIGAVAINLK